MTMSDGDWFAPKRFGYGAGPPIAWQGWALILGFCAILAGAGLLLVPRHHVGIFILIAAVGALALNVIAAQHTRGGWKWRWGGD
jgi:hypothetical protein